FYRAYYYLRDVEKPSLFLNARVLTLEKGFSGKGAGGVGGASGDFVGYKIGYKIGDKENYQEEIIHKLNLFAPKEVIFFPGQLEHFPELKNYLKREQILKNFIASEYFSPQHTHTYINKLIPNYQQDKIIAAEPQILAPISALAFYICSTQNITILSHLRPFRLESDQGKMKVTVNTLIGLEILPKSRQNYTDSLLGFMDRTKTAMGARRLKSLFIAPLRDVKKITERQQMVSQLLKDSDSLKHLRSELESVRDLDRIMAKISTNKINSQDLINLALSIKTYKKIEECVPSNLINLIKTKELPLNHLADTIIKFINNEIGASLENGNLINAGTNKERDHLHDLSTNSSDKILDLENNYREKTKIYNLKVRNNNISGYYIEISKSHLAKVPPEFERKQTLVNSERFVTKELLFFEKEILTAKENLQELEKNIFQEVIAKVRESAPALTLLSQVIAMLDVLQSFAWVAFQENFVMPEIVPEIVPEINAHEKILNIVGGWHPLIKDKL
ncbi:MAG: hypothetical protein HQK53_16775, partial [Oligoflexia bacterium]|nr:hypothetical protein [Oligoflexia bacterium]